jgi:hypothetical protein
MALNRTVAARVVRRGADWSVEEMEELAKYAENGIIYKRKSGTSYFALDLGNKDIPSDQLVQLTDQSLNPQLNLVVPVNALTVKVLSDIWTIETGRTIPQKKSGTSLIIHLVGEIGRDPKTKEIEYGVIYFGSLKDLTADLPQGIDFDAPPKEKNKDVFCLRGILTWKLKANGPVRADKVIRPSV